MSLLPWVALLLSLLFTYFIWQQTARLAEERASDDFSLQAEQIRNAIENRIETYEEVLRGAKGLFAASKEVERSAWHAYVDSLGLDKHYPGILGVGYSVLIRRDALGSHIAEIRSQGFPAYTIRPPGRRDIYTAIVYLEPFSGVNQRAFGYDMWSEPVRRKAMERAMDTGDAAMSGKVLLIQETGKDVQAGFLIYLPVYQKAMLLETLGDRRKSLAGWVYSPFRMNDLMKGILGTRERQFDIEIFDGEGLEPANRMYGSLDHPASRTKNALFRKVSRIEISGHAWTVEITSLPGFESMVDRGRQRAVAMGGMAVSLLLFMLAWLLVHGRSRAIRLAEKMNRDLIESESRFRALYENVPVGVVAIDPGSGLISEVNPKLKFLTGYHANDLKGMNPVDLTYPEDRPETGEKLAEMRGGEISGFRIEKRCVKKDGSVFWAEIMATAIRDEKGHISRVIAIVNDIDERKRWESALKASEQRFQEIIDLMPVALFVKDCSSRIMLMNRACEEQWGMIFSDLQGTDGSRFFPPEQMNHFLAKDREIFEGGVPVDFEEPIWNDRLKENRIVHTYKKPVYDEQGKPIYLIGMTVDVTEQKQKEEELRLAAIVFDIADEAVMITDSENRVLRVNPSFTAITGYGAEEVFGRTPSLLSSGGHDKAFYQALWEKVEKEGAWQGEVWDRRKDGEVYVEWVSVKALKDDAGKTTHHVAVFTDITQRRAAYERAQHLAYYDALTDLPNRTLFWDRLHQALSQEKREKGRLAVMFIDLDRFKPVNDRYGHEVGDLLLKEVARRLSRCVRESDTVSRLGGDEFAVLLQVIEVFSDAGNVAKKIVREMDRPFEISGFSLSVSASIGIALYPDHGETAEALMKYADSAMYRAKGTGGGAYQA